MLSIVNTFHLILLSINRFFFIYYYVLSSPVPFLQSNYGRFVAISLRTHLLTFLC